MPGVCVRFQQMRLVFAGPADDGQFRRSATAAASCFGQRLLLAHTLGGRRVGAGGGCPILDQHHMGRV